MSLALWASQYDAGVRVCADARHHDADRNVIHHDTQAGPAGQAGWDMGINFGTLEDLIQKLTTEEMPAHVPRGPSGARTIQPGSITRLAINVHGDRDGLVYVEGLNAQTMDNENLVYFQHRLSRVRSFLADDAVVMFAGCALAQGDPGTRLLVRLSGVGYFAPCRVVGFTTYGAHYGQNRAAGWGWSDRNCSEPGMRVTNEAYNSLNARNHTGEVLPWASEDAPHAKVAQNGRLIRDADRPVERRLDGMAAALRREIAERERAERLVRHRHRRGGVRRGGHHEGPGAFQPRGPLGAAPTPAEPLFWPFGNPTRQRRRH